MPEDYQLFIQPVERNSEQIAELEAEVGRFLAEVEAKLDALEDLQSRYGGAPDLSGHRPASFSPNQ